MRYFTCQTCGKEKPARHGEIEECRYCSYTEHARRLLVVVRDLRIKRIALLADAYGRYGDHGSLISGVERDHFPEPVKDSLRENARSIGDRLQEAREAWRKAGRRSVTWYPMAQAHRVEGCRY